MSYLHQLGKQTLLIQNEGDHTQVALSSGDSSQQQNQSTGFTTGEWSSAPELFQTGDSLVLRIESKKGVQFIRIQGNQIESMPEEPKLEGAEKLSLSKSDEEIAQMKPMEPMKPMKPMEPMKPMN